MILHIHLLGRPQISRDDQPIEIPGYRPLALLAYLLVTGNAHSRQHLVDLLFEGPDDPRAALRWTLTKLRRAIGSDYILADRSEVAFNFESDYSLDVTALEAGQTDVYQGDFLEGLHLRDAYRFEDWAFFERERLQACYQDALGRQLGEYEDRGDDPGVVEIAHQLLRLDNLREDWYRALMRAYARLGKREAALAQYAQCRQVLEAELGVEPVEETAALAETIEAGHLQLELRQRRAARPVAPPTHKAAPWPRFPTSLVGRAAEMETLRQAWKRAGEGVGQLVLVEGEPGIGKTRLIEELLAEVSDQAVILRAKCPDMGEPLAYTLFVDPLRQALEGGPPPGLSEVWLSGLARLLPDLRERYPDFPQADDPDPAAERRHLFDAVCASLVALAEAKPLVLFLDDLQWADSTSLELLTHFTVHMGEAPVLILGAYRRYEVESGHPLQRAKRDWRRRSPLTTIPLEALSEAATADLLAELTGWRAEDGTFGSLIYRETAGNPLFVVETVASLRDEGRLPPSGGGGVQVEGKELTIPAEVQAVIETRLGRLDELSRQFITAASVMRSSFEAESVQSVSGRSELETIDSLEQLLARGLLVEAEENRFTFSHDNIREVAYEGLSPMRRKLLHRRMAESLERRYRGQEETVPERLAYHYESAGLSDKALDNYLQAGHMARLHYAHETAISHYQKALAYLKAQGDYRRAARTLMQLGLTYHTAFNFQRSRQAYDEGLALWQRVGEMQPSVLPPAAPQTLRLVWVEPPTLDPAVAFYTASEGVIYQLFSGLVALTPEQDVVPDMARSWEVFEGGRKYVFHLRDDVRWSDGAPVTAGDFDYAWKRALDPVLGSIFAGVLYVVKGARDFHQGKGRSQDVGVRALNEVTLMVELEEPTGYFLQLLTLYRTYPVPRHVVEAHGETWTEVGKIVTCGPFELEAWKPGESMHLSRNPDYHGPFGGNLERVELVFRRAKTSADFQRLEMYDMYKADGLDVLDLEHIPMAARDHARQRHVQDYIAGPRLLTWHAGLIVSQPPFDDSRVRRAFALAIDKETLANVVLRGYQFPATGGYLPPGMPGHSAGIGLPYDPDRARQLLAEAGWPDGRGFPAVEALNSPRADSRCEYLKAQWEANLGVEVNFETLEFMAVRHRLDHQPPHMYVLNWWADYPDPDTFLRANPFRRSTRWRNEAYEGLLKEARQALDQADRMNLYRRADQILVDEAPLIPLTYDRTHLLVKPWVSKFPISGTQWWFWKDVIIEPH